MVCQSCVWGSLGQAAGVPEGFQESSVSSFRERIMARFCWDIGSFCFLVVNVFWFRSSSVACLRPPLACESFHDGSLGVHRVSGAFLPASHFEGHSPK